MIHPFFCVDLSYLVPLCSENNYAIYLKIPLK